MNGIKKIGHTLLGTSRRIVFNKDFQAISVVVLAIIFANSFYLFVTNQNPLLQRSGLPLTTAGKNIVPGQNTLDPNDGFTSQALGVAAANQVIEGEIPWWNHYEGVGTPLTGGMQSAGLFPYTLALLLPAGSLIFHMLLEITAAIGMYLLLRVLRLSRSVAVIGGILFGLSGTFAWLTNAAFNPIAFLPWIVLGVEMVRKASRRERIGGIFIISIGLALSLYAGFPETAYVNGLLVAVWALVRLKGIDKKRIRSYILTLMGAALLGLALAAPVLIAFFGYLPISYTGGHEDGGFSGLGVVTAAFSALFLPYIYGSINTLTPYDTTNTLVYLWGNVGGYIGIGVIILAVIALSGKSTLRGLKIALWIWSIICIARIFAFPVITQIVDLIPGISLAAIFRYVPPSISFALIVLAGFGLQQIKDKNVSRKILLTAVGLTTALIVWCITVYFVDGPDFEAAPRYRWWLVGSVVAALGVVGAVWLFARSKFKWNYIVVGGVILVESFVFFMVPQLSAPTRPASVDTAAVTYLKENIGTNRFYTIGPIAPNYGSYFQIASINNNNLPVPGPWANYITDSLNSNTDPVLFIGTYQTDPEGPTPQEEFFKNIDAYKAAGVKYLVTNFGQVSADIAKSANITEVYDDFRVKIYELSGTKSYITTGEKCSYDMINRNSLTAMCENQSQLVRLELYFPGWKAEVNGEEIAIRENSIFQEISLPAGNSVVKFSYQPPYIEFGYAVFAISIATLIVLGYVALREPVTRGRGRISKRRKHD